MSEFQFEPFGEAVAKYAAPEQNSISSLVSKIGIGVFWTLVAGIVIARAVYFNPNIAESFIVSMVKGLHAVFAG